jgi:hypothetical protein
MTYPVTLNWHDSVHVETGPTWNQLCSRIVERFGLPGDRYTTAVSADAMTFNFNDVEDALVAVLIIGERGRNWQFN